MKLRNRIVLCVLLAVSCLFCGIGYAAISDTLAVVGSGSLTPLDLPDVRITSVTPDQSAGVFVYNTNGAVLFAHVTGGGEAKFTVNVINTSDEICVFKRVVEGEETGFEGVYTGTEITHSVDGIAPRDEIAPNGGTLSFELTVNVPAGVTTDYYILKFKFIRKSMMEETDFPEEMPDEEVDVIQRLSDVLNNKYKTETIQNSLDYLINEVIQVRWSPGAPPYVGSMDADYKSKLKELFGDVLTDSKVSFILKNEDLNGDGYTEIAMYSTSDPLDSTSEWPNDGVVCVYITVFTPTLDEWGNINGYTLVCESLRGFAPEVRYGTEDLTPSFSTDHWRDDIGYWVWDDATQTSYTLPIPADAMSNDWTKPLRLDYDSYNRIYHMTWTATTPYGNTLSQCLEGKIPTLP